MGYAMHYIPKKRYLMRFSCKVRLFNLCTVKENFWEVGHGRRQSPQYITHFRSKIEDSTLFAVKVNQLKTIKTQVIRYLLSMEKTAVVICNNTHMLRGIQILQCNGHCYIVTQLCNGVSLRKLIRNSCPLGQEKALKILGQVLKGAYSFIEKGYYIEISKQLIYYLTMGWRRQLILAIAKSTQGHWAANQFWWFKYNHQEAILIVNRRAAAKIRQFNPGKGQYNQIKYCFVTTVFSSQLHDYSLFSYMEINAACFGTKGQDQLKKRQIIFIFLASRML